jgi:hypothetical protein
MKRDHESQHVHGATDVAATPEQPAAANCVLRLSLLVIATAQLMLRTSGSAWASCR